MFYSLESNWYKLTKPSLAGDMPIPQRYYVPDRMRETWRERLQGHNLWHLPGEEPIENARFNLLETKFKKDERSVKEESRRIFNREKVAISQALHFIVVNSFVAGSEQVPRLPGSI